MNLKSINESSVDKDKVTNASKCIQLYDVPILKSSVIFVFRNLELKWNLDIFFIIQMKIRQT